MQYVLQMETFVKKDDEGHPVLPVAHTPFVLEDAVKQFKVFVSGNENMLDAKLLRPLFSVIYFLSCCISFYSCFGTVVLVLRVERTFIFHFVF